MNINCTLRIAKFTYTYIFSQIDYTLCVERSIYDIQRMGRSVLRKRNDDERKNEQIKERYEIGIKQCAGRNEQQINGDVRNVPGLHRNRQSACRKNRRMLKKGDFNAIQTIL